ncbi:MULTISPECIES: transglycosylase SLT domain-containing protein [unclassified Streptomyces]|uniref:transglycosylase SLT domain-containing protein n=1 Tax=unclassified Streptomyces TaxID=2593676 RepID=UPI002E2D0CEF|nr:transglycosylase SLT domain-containing protein [Streptomyces sp. NBC_00223]
MQLPTIPKFSSFNRLSKKRKYTAVGAAAAAALVLTVTGLEATAGTASASAGTASATSKTTSAKAAGDSTGFSALTGDGDHVKNIDAKAGVASQHVLKAATPKKAAPKPVVPAAKKPHTTTAKKHATEAAKAEHAKKATTASRSAKRAEAPKKVTVHKSTVAAPKKTHTVAPKTAAKSYPNNLDGWIRQSLDIMHSKGIPGTYEGIHRNIIRESSGNPKAINLWDINARNGIPSKGLLQVINPTFNRYHVSGTSWDIYNPVSNITAACNYAAARYGTMDNVNSAY